MIPNYFIPPHPGLQPFVDDYILCTSEGKKIQTKGDCPATNETSLICYLADRPSHQSGDGKTSSLQGEGGCVYRPVAILQCCNRF